MDAMSTLASIAVVSWEEVQEVTTSDPIMMMLHDTIVTGFPDDRKDLSEQISTFHYVTVSPSSLASLCMKTGS